MTRGEAKIILEDLAENARRKTKNPKGASVEERTFYRAEALARLEAYRIGIECIDQVEASLTAQKEGR